MVITRKPSHEGGERCVAKLDRDNKIVTEVMPSHTESKEKRGRSWRHVQFLYLVSLLSLGKNYTGI